MTSETYLYGKITRQILPVFEPPLPTSSPALKRLVLPQGELAQLLSGEEAVRYLACFELRQGAVRGNHYHKIKVEWVYVVEGAMQLEARDLTSGQAISLSVEEGELLRIQTDVAHAMRTVRKGYALEFSEVAFDGGDIYRHVLV